MSASSIGLPPQIEQQLLELDKQLRDAAFIRGMGRLIFGTCVILGGSLMLDSVFDLNGTIRGGLLAGWIIVGTVLLWQCLIRPMMQPTSFPALAALIEKQHPELRERLTSLVELRGYEEGTIAPGASKLMQELLARQTVKVFDRLEVGQILPTNSSFRSLCTAVAVVLLLFAPFCFDSDGYGLLWNRFFVPWGNLAWGATFELKVWEGHQTIARGADATVHVSIEERRGHKNPDQNHDLPLWLNWRDEKGVSDSRRFDWDPKDQQYATTLPHVMRSLTFQVTADRAKSGTYRVDVSDPPSITRFHLQIEPAAYTGLPAKTMEGVPGELKVPEFSKMLLNVEFNAPVASAELSWPTVQQEESSAINKPEQLQIVQRLFPIDLSQDHRAGKVEVIASGSGPFVVRAKNEHGLQNEDPARMLLVIPDQPPQILMEGDDQPVLVRPDEVAEIEVEVHDDYGLTAVELHAESSTEIKRIQRLTAEELRDSQIHHQFVLDLSEFGLRGGQVVTYRVRAVDNRPVPNPQEVWSSPRLLMANTSLKQLPDRELANAEKSLEDELTKLRTDVNQAKAELSDLHRKTEDESLGKQGESDKNAKLEEMRQQQEKLIEQLEQLTHRLAERGMTQNLAEQARQIADQTLKKAEDKVQQSKNQPARDQLEPLAQAIDHMGNADRQLGQLEQQLNELNKLEQDLAELSRMAQRAERMADQLEKLEPNQQMAAAESKKDSKQAGESATKKNDDTASQNDANKKDADKNASDKSVRQNEVAANSPQMPADEQKPRDDAAAAKKLQQLKDESQKLSDQLNELLTKHPELLEAARNDQIDRMNQLAEQAKDLGEQQTRLAQALQKSAESAPAPATRRENDQAAPKGPDQQQQGADAVKQQEQLAKSATDQALDMLKQTGSDSDATKAAAEFARKADSASEQAQSGDLKSAAQQAAQAARAADETAKKLDPDGQSNSSQSAQANQLANQQRQVAEQLQKLSDSRDAAQGAQMQGQKRLSDATNRLSEQFQQAADALKAAPLNSPKEATAGEQARQSTQQAQQAMNESEQANRQSNPAQAAQAAAAAAEKLQQAADSVKPLTAKPNSVPVSNRIATPVTEAVKQLEAAQQQLSQNNLSKPGESSENPSPKRGQSDPKGASNEPAGQDPSRSPGQSPNRGAVPPKEGQPSQAEPSGSNSKPPQQGSPQQGSPQQGSPQQGSPQQGSPQQGSPQQGSPQQGSPQQGSPQQGSPQQGSPQQGSPQQGSPQPNSQSGQVPVAKAQSDQAANGQAASKPGKESASQSQGKESPQQASSKGSAKSESEFAQISDQFRNVAALLRQARGELNEHNATGQTAKAQATGNPSPDLMKDSAEGGDTGDVQNRTAMVPDIRQLDTQLLQQNQQNWGRLPGQLRTEILQGAGKKSHSEYRQRIKAYFDEISKPAK